MSFAVPVTMRNHEYLNLRLYYDGYDTPADAKEAAEADVFALTAVVRPPGPFIVGEPEECR